MKESSYKATTNCRCFSMRTQWQRCWGISISSAYELMHDPGFPILKVGRPGGTQGKFITWVSVQTGGIQE